MKQKRILVCSPLLTSFSELIHPPLKEIRFSLPLQYVTFYNFIGVLTLHKTVQTVQLIKYTKRMMLMTSKAAEKRTLILNTTKDFILNHGINDLTLDRIVQQAGISKGGLLYHYPNKLALLEGLTERVFTDFAEKVHHAADEDQEQTGKWTRALIKVSAEDLKQNAELNIGIFTSSLLESNVSDILRQYQLLLNKLEEDDLPKATATTIRLTLDGLYYNQIFNIAPLDDNEMDDIIQTLLRQTYPEVPS